jgi:inorganic phosphate transporter, PiT family
VVGAVIGVGFARGMNALHLGVIWNILKSWVYTIPVAAGLTIGIYLVLKTLWSMAFGPF